MPYEIDDQSIRIVGYYVPIKFYNPSRQLKAEIFLQDDDTLNIGGISSGSIGGTEINITALLDAGFVIVGSDADLSNARSITPGDGIDIVDSGPGGPITILVDVSDFAGSGLEDDGANNLRIAAEAAGDGLAGGSGDPLEVGEGPGVDVTANAVGLGGDTVLLYDSGGDPVAEFAATDGGLTAALAAATAGDVIKLPAGTIAGNHTIPAGVMVLGFGESSVLSGTITNNGTLTLIHCSGTVTNNGVFSYVRVGNIRHVFQDNGGDGFLYNYDDDRLDVNSPTGPVVGATQNAVMHITRRLSNDVFAAITGKDDGGETGTLVWGVLGLYLGFEAHAFIGSQDAYPFVLRTDNEARVIIRPTTGRVGIRADAYNFVPDEQLHVIGNIKASGQLISAQATGTPPAVVASTTKVTNFNADKWDDLDAPADAVGALTNDGSGNLSWEEAGSALIVEEEDGAPTGTPATLKFPNNSLTDNGDGTFSVANIDQTIINEAIRDRIGTATYKLKMARQELQNLTAGSTLTLANLTSQSGMIMAVWIACDGSGPYRDNVLRVYVDGEASPSIEFDLGSMGLHWNAFNTNFATRHVGIETAGSGDTATGFTFKFPIPFATSAKVDLYNPTATTSRVFSQVFYTNDITDDRRLHSEGITYLNRATVAAGGSYNFLDIEDSGTLVWHSLICKGASNMTFLESDVIVTVDGSLDIVNTGTEDWFYGAWYYRGGKRSWPWVFVSEIDEGNLEHAAGVDLLELFGGIKFTTSLELDWDCSESGSNVDISYVVLYYSGQPSTSDELVDGSGTPGNVPYWVDADTLGDTGIAYADLQDDPDAIHDNVAGEIAAIAEKVAPVDADMIVIEDSEDLNAKKMVQIGNLTTGAGKYRQFTYTVSGGDFSFVIDGDGRPVMALQELEE